MTFEAAATIIACTFKFLEGPFLLSEPTVSTMAITRSKPSLLGYLGSISEAECWLAAITSCIFVFSSIINPREILVGL